MSYDGYQNGKKNYSYIRELRNSIIHRGLDVTSSAHVLDDFPMIIAPPFIVDRYDTKQYQAFAYYLLDIISKCEAVIPPLILKFLEDEKIIYSTISEEELKKLKEKHKQEIINSVAMPD